MAEIIGDFVNPKKLEDQIVFYNNCKNDPIFFIENCVTVPDPGGYKLIKLYEPQKKVIESFISDHFIIMLKSRQTGGSTITQALLAWCVLFFENYICGIVSRSGFESSSFNKKILGIIDNIPQDFMRPQTKDFVERNALSFKLKNDSQIISQAVSPSNPESIFRGTSISTLCIDEAAFIRHIDVAFTALSPTLSIAQKKAEDSGLPFGNIIISTPNGKSGPGNFYYIRWMDSITSEEPLYKPHKLHWKDIPGLDDEWYKKQCDKLMNDPRKIGQELEMLFVSSDDSIWDDVIQTKLTDKSNSKEKNYKEVPFNDFSNINMRLFDSFSHIKPYFVGVDCAAESGMDYSAIQVVDMITGTQAIEIKCKLEPKLFANKIVKHVLNMIPRHLVIVENTGGYGSVVLAELRHDTKKNYNIFGEMRITGDKNKKKKWIAGLNTNSKTRPLILEAMFNQVRQNIDDIHSDRLCLELLSLVDKNGKIQADSGLHDDLVMAYALCFYVRDYCKEDYYDIISKAKAELNEQTNVVDLWNLGNDRREETFVIDMNKHTNDSDIDDPIYNSLTPLNKDKLERKERENIETLEDDEEIVSKLFDINFFKDMM